MENWNRSVSSPKERAVIIARFFLDLGFVVPPELDEIAGDEFYGALSRERADLLDDELFDSHRVCGTCKRHFPMRPRERIALNAS